ncbi:MAG: tetratricopeptide repeat protein [Nitrospiraceae bacterium]
MTEPRSTRSTDSNGRAGSSSNERRYLPGRSRWFAVGWLVLALATVSCEARRADRAYLRGDYGTAYKELLYLAEAGDARSQYDLGVMYDTGRGVPQSNEEALKWYGMAAKQGEARAQYNLGLMYANGQGVPQDHVEAYFWISLSAGQGNRHALDARDYYDEKMTAEQVAKARQRLHQHEEAKKKSDSCPTCGMFGGKSSP